MTNALKNDLKSGAWLTPRILIGAWANAQFSMLCWVIPRSKEASEINIYIYIQGVYKLSEDFITP